jgi:choline dehydrogenase-like flavoprotein
MTARQDAPPAWPTGRFGARERRVLRAAGEVLLPPGGDPGPGAVEVGAAPEAVQLIESRVVLPIRLVVRLVLWVFELWTLPTSCRPFSALPLSSRQRVLERAAASRLPIRSGQVDLLKHVLVNAYVAAPEVSAAIGYDRAAVLARCDGRGRAPADSRGDDARAAPGDAAADPTRPTPRLEPRTWPGIPRELRADVVVIGSGAGGAPVAARLAEAGLDVVVVEEGGYHPGDQLRDDPPWNRFLGLYRDMGITGTIGRPPIPVPLGRAVGGTTVVNAGTCFRPPDPVLERWSATLGIDAVTPADLAPYVAEVERVQGVTVPPEDVLGRNAEIFRDGVVKLAGHPGEPLARNCRGCRGCGESVVGCAYEAKQAVHLTWLPRAEGAGATIFSRVRVDRVVHIDGRVRGVDATVLDPGWQDIPRGRVRIRAPRVVVAAGAFHTPALLDRSGVPDPSRIRGRNLQIHPAVGIAAEMPEEVESWRGVLQSWGVDDLVAEHGIMIEATAAPPPVTGGQVPFVGAELKELIAASSRVATSGFLIEDSTTGRLLRAPAGRVTAAYQLSADDRRRIAIGFAWVAEAFLEAGALRVLVGRPDQRWATTSEEVRAIREEGVPPEVLKLSAYHPVGTHRLAARPADGPADPWGAVRGTDGLWVADASLLPTCIGVNPQITIMAFALRTADRILAKS